MTINKSSCAVLSGTMALLFHPSAWALDSYRFLHVTIDTPWLIFLFLLPVVLSPFILMAVLYWRFSGRKPNTGDRIDSQ